MQVDLLLEKDTPVEARNPHSWHTDFERAMKNPVYLISRINYLKLADKMNILKKYPLVILHLYREPDKLDLLSLIHSFVEIC